MFTDLRYKTVRISNIWKTAKKELWAQSNQH